MKNPLREICTAGSVRGEIPSEPWWPYSGTKLETADTAKESLQLLGLLYSEGLLLKLLELTCGTLFHNATTGIIRLLSFRLTEVRLDPTPPTDALGNRRTIGMLSCSSIVYERVHSGQSQ